MFQSEEESKGYFIWGWYRRFFSPEKEKYDCKTGLKAEDHFSRTGDLTTTEKTTPVPKDALNKEYEKKVKMQPA